MEKLAKTLIACMVLALTTSCIGELEPEEEGDIVGYETEFGTQVVRYAADNVCKCNGNGIDGDCFYTYYSALELCEPSASLANASGWSNVQGYYNFPDLTNIEDIMCGFPLTRALYLDGAYSLKVYGIDVSVGTYILDIYGNSDATGSCATSSSTPYCLVPDIEPPTGHVFPYASIEVEEDSTLVGIRMCEDPDASDD